MPPKQTKRATGTVGEGAAGKKAKATQHAGGQSVSEKSQATRTSKNVFEKSNSKTQYFVREVKGRRMTKNGVEFLIGWRDFPLDKDDTWEPITNLPGSEHMIAEFQRHWEEQYKIKTSEQLQSVIDKRNTLNEKNAQQHERNTAADMDEARADGDDDDEGGNSEDDHGEYEDGSGSTGDGTTCRTGGSQTRTRTGKVFFLLHHYLTLTPNLSASVTTNTSPHRGHARVTGFLQWNIKAFTTTYRILR